ncbi:DUF1284 domain-containing protein [Candidatus Woesearchaeota archaeon]|nr:DUF1284 domain-containing protein [Candidatus Woesearchaeota archaeon]
MTNDQEEKIRLRGHHIKILWFYKRPELFDLSDDEYVERFNRECPDWKGFYSDEHLLKMRDMFRKFLENPTLKFEYIEGLDSICGMCDHEKECGDPEHIYHKMANQLDQMVAADIPEMQVGHDYDTNDILDICRKKGWLEEQTPKT